ncbi:MAG: FtsQ-type POTRA domain-containing protein [Ilumatobacteraceae bacterium]
MNEPTPPHGDHVLPSVLDELRAAFGSRDLAASPETAHEAPQPDAEPAEPVVAEPAVAEPTPDPPTIERRTIKIGSDDELPDAVYLEAPGPAAERSAAELRSTDGGGGGHTTGGTTIVIGDELDASGAFDAVEAPSRSMDPRLRARRIAVKRAQGRKRLLWAAGIGGAVVAVVAVLAVFASSLFAVEVIDLQGAVYSQARYGDQLQRVIDELEGEPVLLVDTMRAERELETIPWVERAFVSTDFPNRVIIDIRERRPLATYQGSDQRYRVIDADGRVLDVLDGRPVDYILLTGVGPDLEPGSMSGTQFAQAAQMVGALPGELRAITESGSVDATTGDLGLQLAGGVSVRIGTFDRLDSKLARLLQQVRDGLDGIGSLDVSTDEVIQTPASGG